MRRVPARQIRRGADRSNAPATPAADGLDRARSQPSARFVAAMLVAIRLDSCRAVLEYRASGSDIAPLALLVCRQIGPPGSTGVMQSDHLQVQRTVRPQAHPKLALASPTQARKSEVKPREHEFAIFSERLALSSIRSEIRNAGRAFSRYRTSRLTARSSISYCRLRQSG